MLEASLFGAVCKIRSDEQWAHVIVNFFMELRDNVEIMGLLADQRLLQLEVNLFMNRMKEEQHPMYKEPPVAMATFAIAADGGCGDAASSPPGAAQNTRSKQAHKKKKWRQSKAMNNAGDAGSE